MKCSNGFTLIELVLVIIVVGIIAITAAPKLGNLSSYNLERAGHDLIEAVRYTQEQSMTHSGAAPFQIVISANGFTVTQSGAPITNPLDGSSGYSENSTEWAGVSITSASHTLPETISFNSRGKPTCSSTACSNPSESSVSLSISNGTSLSVTIEKFTGYAYRN